MFRTIRRGPTSGVACSVVVTPGSIVVSVSAMTSLLALDPRPRYRIVLAQWVTFPIVRHHDAPQIGMAQKFDTEQIEHFAFVPVRTAPHSCYRFDHRVFAAHTALEPYALIPFDRVQVVHHFKSWFRRIAVHRAHRAQADELLVVFQESADTCKLARRDLQRELAAIQLAYLDRIGVERVDSGSNRILLQVFG